MPPASPRCFRPRDRPLPATHRLDAASILFDPRLEARAAPATGWCRHVGPSLDRRGRRRSTASRRASTWPSTAGSAAAMRSRRTIRDRGDQREHHLRLGAVRVLWRGADDVPFTATSPAPRQRSSGCARCSAVAPNGRRFFRNQEARVRMLEHRHAEAVAAAVDVVATAAKPPAGIRGTAFPGAPGAGARAACPTPAPLACTTR